MCNTAPPCVRIAIERACDDAKDALMLRSARYNQAHGLPLSSAHLVALAAEVRKTLGVLKQLHKGLVSFEEACAQLDLPELPVFPHRPHQQSHQLGADHPTKWAPRRFGWDEGAAMPNPLTPNWRTGLATGALVLAVAAYGNHTSQQQQANNAEAEDAAAIASRQWAAEVICEGNRRYHWADAHAARVCQPTPAPSLRRIPLCLTPHRIPAMTTVTTIHLIDQPGGGVAVCTTGTPHPGQRLTPGQALATDLLRECTHRASDVRYWQGCDKAMAFVLELSSPEGLGYADKATLHAAARAVLGRPTAWATSPPPASPHPPLRPPQPDPITGATPCPSPANQSRPPKAAVPPAKCPAQACTASAPPASATAPPRPPWPWPCPKATPPLRQHHTHRLHLPRADPRPRPCRCE